ncbi:unnamed protein product [Phaedon cochleariae]|uniref:Lipase n=1 Tax=Phaedon cochleariae TaxID=80249 RepID=A0A9P0DD42_PHACE|nr:unnamed protein product [Phaedon cochleariae]
MYSCHRLVIALITVVYLIFIDSNIVQSIKVCRSISDYSLLNIAKKNCYDDPVTDLNISEIIRSWPGFTAEEHYLTTEDGYKVLVERSYSKITQKTPIIIVHGIAMSALGWVNRGNVSIARLLGELGYDVWMLNYRGTWYSKGHVNLTTNNPEYWKYNVNDLGNYDVRSTVRMVYEQTNRKAIYIGYSMGTTGFFIYSSTFPNEAKKYTKGMIGLAPAINFRGTKSVIRYTSPVWPILKRVIYSLWNGEILPGFSVLLKPLLASSAGIYTIQSVVNLIFGDDYAQMDPLRYPQFVTQLLDTAGVEVWSHYLQIYESGVFQNYDYGEEINLQKYGTSTPPKYDLQKIPVPISLFVGANDWLATPLNAEELYSGIQPSIRCGYHVVPYEKFSHTDFLVAKDLPTLLYKYLFEVIREHDEGRCEATTTRNG